MAVGTEKMAVGTEKMAVETEKKTSATNEKKTRAPKQGHRNPNQPPTKIMFEGAALLADGLSFKQAAKKLGISDRTLYDWMSREDMQEYRDGEIRRKIRASRALAVQVLTKQLTNKNPWVAQNAANSVMRSAEKLEENGAPSLVVEFSSMPAPGMPGDDAGKEPD